MKKLILAVFISTTLLAYTNASAYGIAFLQSCTFGYNAAYGEGGYTGVYRYSGDGKLYTYFFPRVRYNYCPQTINF